MKGFKYIKALGLTFVIGLFAFTGCSDDVDDSNLYSFTGDLISSYLDKDANFSDYVSLLKRVRLSNTASTTVYDLLSTRGHYSCFAPTNDAVRHYVDSIMGQPNYPIEQLDDSLVSLLVKNSIIDCGDEDAYLTSSFTSGALTHTNLNERYMTVDFDTLNGRVSYIINSNSRISVPDVELENGVLQVVDNVVTSSMADLPSLMGTIPNLKIFTQLLRETGWDVKLQPYLDAEYEEWRVTHTEGPSNYANINFPYPRHHNAGFTAFVETDSLYQSKWGITPQVDAAGDIVNWDQIKQVFDDKCSQMQVYAETSAAHGNPSNWKDPNNVVNQFVAYHLLNMSIPYNLLVIHMNELGYSYLSPNRLTLNITENYITMGDERRILRVTEGATTNGKRINRYSKYDRDTYDETLIYDPGLLISSTNSENGQRYVMNALNGFYYPIDDILEYSKHVRDDILNDRLRFDIQTYTVEAGNNDFRDPLSPDVYSIPAGYFSAFVRVSDQSTIVFKNQSANQKVAGQSGNVNWRDYQLTENQVVGQYDFTILLPPVPTDGTYEVRFGLSNNPNRGMAQAYIGDNPDNLSAIGLPLDLRLTSDNPSIGWVQDDPDDPSVATENDKTLRNHGYMKAPKIFGIVGAEANPVESSVRDLGGNSCALRKILWTGNLEAGKKYYVRFKSVLESPLTQFFVDYFELVPKSVYAGAESEDIW